MKTIEANTFFKKFKGLMFVKDFDYILKFKSNGIHTFFMKIPIDVYLTDDNYKIIYIYKNLKPWKVVLPKKGIKYTFETPINKCDFEVGDIFH